MNTPVIKHSNGKSPFSIGNTSSKAPFSIAMLDYRSVALFGLMGLNWINCPVELGFGNHNLWESLLNHQYLGRRWDIYIYYILYIYM